MCGITACLQYFSDRYKQHDCIKQMMSTLTHRGPDGWGIYTSPEIALGHTRLSVVDIVGGKQPMISERYAIAYNGETYNYLELKDNLIKSGVTFKTESDTEVVLKAFETYGPEAFKMLNGQFAMIIWDRKEKKAIIARDRYGIRPLYVLTHGNAFYFSSEMKAFDTIPGYRRTINSQYLFQHGLIWNTVDDATIYENIRTVPGGTYEIYSPGKAVQKQRYYEIGESSLNPPNSIHDAKEQFLELLTDAVELRLRSDVPVATYLSGGVDSSVISHLVAQKKTEQFKTFSVTFKDIDFDESFFQKEMLHQLDTEHFSQNITYQKIDDNLLDAVFHSERPFFRTAPVPLFLLSKKVHDNNIKVVLTGEGADEILYGYDSFKELKLLDFWNTFPSSGLRPKLIKKLYPHLQHYNDPKQFGLMKMYYEGFLPEYGNKLAGLNIRVHNNKVLATFFNKDYRISFNGEEFQENIKAILPVNFSSWSLLQQNQFLEMKTLLSGYLLSSQGDRMSMAHSVEGRYPFLDHRLVEQVFNFPDNYKMRVFSQKHLLSETFKNIIPASIINRPKRPYMAPDLKSFFKNGKPTETTAYFLSNEKIDDYGTFDKKYIQRFLKKFSNTAIKNIGYRDNMIITFILSTQMATYWTRNPQVGQLDENLKDVEFMDYSN